MFEKEPFGQQSGTSCRQSPAQEALGRSGASWVTALGQLCSLRYLPIHLYISCLSLYLTCFHRKVIFSLFTLVTLIYYIPQKSSFSRGVLSFLERPAGGNRQPIIPLMDRLHGHRGQLQSSRSSLDQAQAGGVVT